MRSRRTRLREKKEGKKREHIKKNGAFFNKDGKYKTGHFYSRKMQTKITYKSSYEYTFYKHLESNTEVVKFFLEPIKIPYVDADGLKKNYIPDCLVLYSDGRIELCEIKPSNALKAINVKRKARAAVNYLKEHSPNVTYRFVTEKEIFKIDSDYKKVLKELKK
jgi:tnsA endonuclease N terminal